MDRLRGRTVYITGAASGVGRIVAEKLAAEGARIGILSRGKAEEFGRALGGGGVSVDLSDPEAAATAVQRLAGSLGPPTDLVNNLGGFVAGTIEATEPAQVLALFRTGVLSGFSVTRAVVPHLKKALGGRITFTGSASSLRGRANMSAYTIAKHAVLGMARALHEELRTEGILVGTVLPIGAISLPSGRRQDPKSARGAVRAEDVAAAHLRLLSQPADEFVRELELHPAP